MLLIIDCPKLKKNRYTIKSAHIYYQLMHEDLLRLIADILVHALCLMVIRSQRKGFQSMQIFKIEQHGTMINTMT